MGFWLFFGVWGLGWCFIPQLLLLNKRPTATLAWLWALLLFPGIGLALFLMIGTERVKRRRMKRRSDFRGKERWSSARSNANKTWRLLAKEALDPSAHALFHGLTGITHLPVATASSLKLLRKAPAFYDALEADIQAAKREIHFETYIWRNDEVGKRFLDLLVAAAQRGVTVRVLIDELGSLALKETYFKALVEAGGIFSWGHTLSPLQNRYSFNLRNHRKLQIIDGSIAYVGGMNFGREYLGHEPRCGNWSDLQIRVEGTVVEVLQEIFAEDWFFATGKEDMEEAPALKRKPDEKTFVQVLRGGPDEMDHPMLRVNLALISAAKTRLWIATGYFVPGETMQFALQVAAARGVDVRLLISQKSEHPLLVKAGRSYYEALLRQGIRIFEYDQGIEHSKYMIIDEEWASVGSTNLDERSLRLNFELSLLAYCPATNKELAQIFEATLAQSHEIDQCVFSQRPYLEKLTDSALRPFSPVL